MSCSRQEIVDAWERQGAGAELPPALKEHQDGCPVCAARVEEVLSMRALVAQLPTTTLPEDSVAHMRAQLIARAHELSEGGSDTEVGEGEAVTNNTSRLATVQWTRMTWVAVAVAALLLVGFGFALRWWMEPATPDGSTNYTASQPQPPPERESAGFWIAEGDAQVEQISAGPHEVVWLRHGAAWFKVNPLLEGSVFRVIAGDSEVEVVGTRFRVDVERGRLRSVQVAEGRVLVRTQGQQAADLTAGERWVSPELAQAQPTQEAPEATDAPTPADVLEQRAQDAPEPDDAVAELVPPAPRVEAPGNRETRHRRASAKKSAQRPPSHSAVVERDSTRKKPTPVARPGLAQEETAPQGAAKRDDAPARQAQPGAANTKPLEETKPSKEQAPSVDERFAEAWALYQAGRFRAAAHNLDSISKMPQQDSARRAEILYWAARAHLHSGSRQQAARHLRRSLQLSPQGWWADDARHLLKALTPTGE